MEQIYSQEQYNQIVERYDRKGRLTNDYLQNQVEELIAQGRLFALLGIDNIYLLVRKDGFFRLYYYINNLREVLALPKDELVTEILFRSAQGEPLEQINYLESCGFIRHLRRDLLFAKYSDFSFPVNVPDVVVAEAQSLEEVQWAAELFNTTFDKWSGDYISPSEYSTLLSSNSMIIAKDKEGNLLGSFESGIEKGINWLRHFAVTEVARGRGVGKALLDAVIEKGHVDGNSRYMLWSQHNNVAAMRMYEKKGFSLSGKSTLSMIRL